MKIIGVVVLAGLAALSACTSPQKRTESLMETSMRYQEGLRWARFEDAASHVPPAEREAFLDEHDKLGDDLRIDDYEVIRVHFKDNHDEAQVQVKYSWHLDGQGVVKETVTDQRWKLHGSAWWLEDETKKRGEDMPGIDVTPAKDGAAKKHPHASPVAPDDQAPAPPPEDSEPVGAPGGNASGAAPL